MRRPPRGEAAKRHRPHTGPGLGFIARQFAKAVNGYLAAVQRAREAQQLARAYEMLASRLVPTWAHFAVLPFSEPAIACFE